MKEQKLVIVEWNDSVFNSSWIDEGEVLDLIPITTVGILVGETKGAITLGMEYYPEENEFRYHVTIPKSLITKRRGTDLSRVGRKSARKSRKGKTAISLEDCIIPPALDAPPEPPASSDSESGESKSQ